MSVNLAASTRRLTSDPMTAGWPHAKLRASESIVINAIWPSMVVPSVSPHREVGRLATNISPNESSQAALEMTVRAVIAPVTVCDRQFRNQPMADPEWRIAQELDSLTVAEQLS